MTTNSKLADAILGYVVVGGGAEAVSYIHRNLREDGWRNLGCLAAFEKTCRDLGFEVRQGKNERNQLRTEVAL